MIYLFQFVLLRVVVAVNIFPPPSFPWGASLSSLDQQTKRYDQPLYARLHKECGNFSDHDVTLKGCSSALAEMNKKVGAFDVYNIYDTCGHDTSSIEALRTAMLSQTVRAVFSAVQVGQTPPMYVLCVVCFLVFRPTVSSVGHGTYVSTSTNKTTPATISDNHYTKSK